jgi:ABC-type branched-subunit amino acid transport system substrate-binding protein/DNA-binding beta-propeller fold protein YncE
MNSPIPEDRFLIIAVEESDSTIGFYDSESHKEIARIEVGLWPHEIDLSADRSKAYVTNFGVKDYDEKIGTPGASISVIDIKNKCEVDRLYTFGSLDANGMSDRYRTEEEYRRYRGPHGVKVSPDGRHLLVNVETENAMLVYDLEEGRGQTPSSRWKLDRNADIESLPDEIIALPGGTHNFMFSKDGKVLWVVSGQGGVTEYDVATRKPLRGFRCNGAVRGLTYNHDETQLIASATNEICLISPMTLLRTKVFNDLNVRQLLYSQPTPDGRYILAPAVWEGQLLRIDLHTSEVKRIIVGIDPIHILIGPDYVTKKLAYVSHGRSKYISVIDCEKFEEVAQIPTKGGPNGIAWAPFSAAPVHKKLVFGACLPLSGPSIVEGQDLRLGYQFWEEKVNAAGGLLIGGSIYDIDIVYADTRSRVGSEPEEPVPWQVEPSRRTPPEKNFIEKLTEELIDREKVDFLLGTYPSPPNLHCARVAEERGIPFITASGAASIIYEQGFQNVFGIMTVAAGFLNESFRLLAELEEPPKSVVFLSCVDPAALQDAVTTAKFVQQDLQMVVIPPPAEFVGEGAPGIWTYPHGNTDFSRAVEVAQRVRPDVLAITGHLPESIGAVRSAVKVGFDPKAILFSVGPAFPQFTEELRSLAQHMTGAAMWSSVQKGFGHDRFQTPGAFANAFYERYSRKPAYLAAGAFACGLTFEEAFRRAGQVKAKAVVDAMHQPDFRFESFYSLIEFDEAGLNSERPLVTIQLRFNDQGEIQHIPLWPKRLAGSNQMVWPLPGWNPL